MDVSKICGPIHAGLIVKTTSTRSYNCSTSISAQNGCIIKIIMIICVNITLSYSQLTFFNFL